jgi:hypothetical protein
MGIHHTYKSNRGERSLVKQQKQDELRRRADHQETTKSTPAGQPSVRGTCGRSGHPGHTDQS